MVKRKYDELLEKLNECTSKDIASALGALDEDKLKDVITNPTVSALENTSWSCETKIS